MSEADETLRDAVALAWVNLQAWEKMHALAGGVPYTWESRQRAVCHLVCLQLSLPVPEALRGFPPEVEAAVKEGAPAWPS